MAPSDNFSKRLISAAILLPISALLLYWGPPLLYFWMGALIAGMCWEVWALSRKMPLFCILALLYVVTSAIAFVHLGSDPLEGLPMRIWIVALVVSADSLAYFLGRAIGGRKLAPRISPGKTWAGLGGAILGAMLAGWVCGLLFEGRVHYPLIILSAFLGIVEQAGDLLESWFKRRFGVKDSSSLIPGHGGLLDRLDGALAVSLTLMVMGFITKESIWLWQ